MEKITTTKCESCNREIHIDFTEKHKKFCRGNSHRSKRIDKEWFPISDIKIDENTIYLFIQCSMNVGDITMLSNCIKFIRSEGTIDTLQNAKQWDAVPDPVKYFILSCR